MNDNWHKRFIQLAETVASWSKDPSTKVGCVIVDPRSNAVLSLGFNGFPRGVQERAIKTTRGAQGVRLVESPNDLHPTRWERPEKYMWIEHAERNAVFNAARNGVAITGAWAYLNYTPTPCTDCARALIQAGIRRIIGPDRAWDGNGTGAPYEVGDVSRTMLHEAGVVLVVVP